MNFIDGARTDSVTTDPLTVPTVFYRYVSFLGDGKQTSYYLSLLNRTICLLSGAAKSGSGCVGLANYDLGLAYPLPLIPNGNFRTDPSAALSNVTFEVKG